MPAEIIVKEPSPPASRQGPQVSCFQNDLRPLGAEVAKGCLTDLALTSPSPWVGSDLLTCTPPKGRRMGRKALWVLIQNIIHFTIFVLFSFVLKRIFGLFSVRKIQPCRIPVLEKSAKAPFLCSSPVLPPNGSPVYSESAAAWVGPNPLAEEVYAVALFHSLI